MIALEFFIARGILGAVVGAGLALWIADYLTQRKKVAAQLAKLQNELKSQADLLEFLEADRYDLNGEELPF